MTRFVCEWLILALLFSSAYGGAPTCSVDNGPCSATGECAAGYFCDVMGYCCPNPVTGPCINPGGPCKGNGQCTDGFTCKESVCCPVVCPTPIPEPPGNCGSAAKIDLCTTDADCMRGRPCCEDGCGRKKCLERNQL